MRTAPLAGGGTSWYVATSTAALLAVLFGCRTPDDISPLDAAVSAVQVRQYSGGQAVVELELSVTNPNKFEVSLTGVSGELSVEGVALGVLRWSGEAPIRKSGVSVASISSELGVGDHGSIFAALIDGNPLDYTLRGELAVARGVLEKTMPLAAEGTINAASGGD